MTNVEMILQLVAVDKEQFNDLFYRSHGYKISNIEDQLKKGVKSDVLKNIYNQIMKKEGMTYIQVMNHLESIDAVRFTVLYKRQFESLYQNRHNKENFRHLELLHIWYIMLPDDKIYWNATTQLFVRREHKHEWKIIEYNISKLKIELLCDCGAKTATYAALDQWQHFMELGIGLIWNIAIVEKPEINFLAEIQMIHKLGLFNREIDLRIREKEKEKRQREIEENHYRALKGTIENRIRDAASMCSSSALVFVESNKFWDRIKHDYIDFKPTIQETETQGLMITFRW